MLEKKTFSISSQCKYYSSLPTLLCFAVVFSVSFYEKKIFSEKFNHFLIFFYECCKKIDFKELLLKKKKRKILLKFRKTEKHINNRFNLKFFEKNFSINKYKYIFSKKKYLKIDSKKQIQRKQYLLT
jgi:hypothetical protein